MKQIRNHRKECFTKLFIVFSMAFFTTTNSAQTISVKISLEDILTDFAFIYSENESQVNEAKKGERIFSDQEYLFSSLPSFLEGKNYIVANMNAENRVVPVTEGVVLVVTPRTDQPGSQEESLIADGFSLVDYPSFSLFDGQKGEIGIFRKEIAYKRFRLPDIRHESWAVVFFENKTLSSFSVPAEIIWNPGPPYAKNSRLWQGCPSIEKTGERYWGAWFSGGVREPDKGNYSIISISEDGKHWVDPAIIITHPDSNVRVMDPQLWTDPQGRLWVFWVQNTGQKGFDGIWGTWAVRIDNPEEKHPSWTAPKRLCDGLTRCKPIVLLTDEWLLPSYNWINHQSNVYISDDQGESWTLQGGPVNPPVSNFYEHMCVELKNGNIWMLQRNIQQSISVNKGKDWTPLKNLDGVNSANSRLYIGRLQSGNLLLIYNDDPSVRRNLTAFISKDDGQTWPCQLLLDDRDEVSYPDVVQDQNGVIHVCYDRSRRGEKEILMATFLESDIEEGKFVSKQAREKIIISKVE